MQKNREWEQFLWGVEFLSPTSIYSRTLIGSIWHKEGTPYRGEPTRALLFTTRQEARRWCAEKMRGWRENRKPGDPVLRWKVRPVRVCEAVRIVE